MKPPLERYYEIGNRLAPLAGVGDDSSDGGECVLDAMVKLGVQASSRVLSALALGHIVDESKEVLRATCRISQQRDMLVYPYDVAVLGDASVLDLERRDLSRKEKLYLWYVPRPIFGIDQVSDAEFAQLLLSIAVHRGIRRVAVLKASSGIGNVNPVAACS
jgi:hypothetical protein